MAKAPDHSTNCLASDISENRTSHDLSPRRERGYTPSVDHDAARAAGTSPPRLLCFTTKGAGSNDEARIVKLLSAFSPVVWPYDRSARVRGIWRLLREIRQLRPDLVVMEGSGSPGGLAVMIARLLFGVPYIVSSGDAIAQFLTMQ